MYLFPDTNKRTRRGIMLFIILFSMFMLAVLPDCDPYPVENKITIERDVEFLMPSKEECDRLRVSIAKNIIEMGKHLKIMQREICKPDEYQFRDLEAFVLADELYERSLEDSVDNEPGFLIFDDDINGTVIHDIGESVSHNTTATTTNGLLYNDPHGILDARNMWEENIVIIRWPNGKAFTIPVIRRDI